MAFMLTGQPPKIFKMSKYLKQKTYAQATKPQNLAHSLPLFERTLKPIKDLKLPYDNPNETAGDGNCFYNAIIDQKENNPRVAESLSDEARNCSTPKDLREKVIDFIVEWPDVLNQESLLVARDIMITRFRERKNLPTSYTQEGIWQRYLLPEQRECGVYAEDFIIQCTPTFLCKDVFALNIYSS